MKIIGVFRLGRLCPIRPSVTEACETCSSVIHADEIEKYVSVPRAIVVCACGLTRFIVATSARAA